MLDFLALTVGLEAGEVLPDFLENDRETGALGKRAFQLAGNTVFDTAVFAQGIGF